MMSTADMDFLTEDESTVCFTGHRTIPESDRSGIIISLQQVMEDAFRMGFRRFLCGGAVGFDTIAALEVLAFRESHPSVRLIIAVPCRSQPLYWPLRDREIYQSVLDRANEVRILSDHYYNGCMQARNHYMVNHSSLCVCYMKQMKGGTWSTVRYAMHRGIRIINLAMPSPDLHSVLKEPPWKSIYISPSAPENVSIVHLSHSPERTTGLMRISSRCLRKRP